MKIIKKIFKIFLIILGICIVICLVMIPFAMQGLKEIKGMTIENVNLTTIEDGKYTGEFKEYRWSNKVEVTVEDHKIINIKVINDSNPSLSKKLINKIIDKQEINVDTVSGATVSSKAFLKAIENALNK